MKRLSTRIARLLSLICAFALVGLAMPAAPALAAPVDSLDIDFSISPGEMVAPGDATMTFIIANHTGYDIQNVYLSSADGLLSEPIGHIDAGETQTLVRPHAVTQQELDDGEVRYVLTHDAAVPGGEKVTLQLSAAVVMGSARPDVDFTRQLSSQVVTAGSQLTITYKISNNGNVPVSGIVVRDALGDFTGRLEQLAVGATRAFISRVTIGAEAESVASVEYTVPSGETFTRRLDPIAIRLSDSALSAEFSVGRSAFDPDRADAVLMLTNTGSDDYTGITVLDDVYGGIIADAVTLPSGGNPYEIAHTYPLRDSTEYRWRVKGANQAGEALDFVTETVTLEEEPVARSIGVSLAAAARTPNISRAGSVTFDIAVTNTGTVTAESVRIYEVDRGDVRELAVLPTGDPARFSVSYEVDEDQQFIFCAGYADENGRQRTVTAGPVDVTISASGVSPERRQADGAGLGGSSFKMGTTSTFTILLVVASAALVSMFTLLLVTSLRARRDRRRRIAAQKRRIREELGRTNPFTPIKRGAAPRGKSRAGGTSGKRQRR